MFFLVKEDRASETLGCAAFSQPTPSLLKEWLLEFIDVCTYLRLFRIYIAVYCGALVSPVNGQVSYTAGTRFGQTATYSCSTGYNLVGSSTRTCQATGRWSGSATTCQGVLCYKSIIL